MKKILLPVALFCGFTFCASAQTPKVKTTTPAGTERETLIETTTTSTSQTTYSKPETNNAAGLKAASGEITLEANVNLLGGSVNLSNALQQVKGRYFLSDDMVLRLGANLRYSQDSPTPNTEQTAVEVSIAPGIEKHFAGTNRLSPYVGAELLMGFRSANSETELSSGGNVKVKGSWSATNNMNRGYFMVGLAGIGGFDFYVARHLFVGYELSLELTNRSFSEIETTTTSSSGMVTTDTVSGNNALAFGPNVRNGIRVGFVF